MATQNVPHFHAVIVGAGMAGALIAKRLAKAGKSVLILEAGPSEPANVNGYMDKFFLSSPKVPESPYPPDVFSPSDVGAVNAGRPTSLMLDKDVWQRPEKSYLIQTGPRAFASTYERVSGGTARHWLGISLRFLPNDFKMKSIYGQLADWPIEYGQLESYYELAESEIGVAADSNEQKATGTPFRAGYQYPMPPIPSSYLDLTFERLLGKDLLIEGRPVTIMNVPVARNSQPYQQRRVCAGNTNCIPICPIQAKFDPTVTLNEALATGNVKIWYQAVATEVKIDANGRVNQIQYLRYEQMVGGNRGAGSVTADAYILAAHAIETPTLLLRSTNGGRTPAGVANRKDWVGRNLMDHPYYVCWGLLPEPVWPYRGPLLTSGIENLRDGDFRRIRGAYRVDIGNEGWNFVVGGMGGDPNVTTTDLINGTNLSGANPALAGNPGRPLFGKALTDKLNNILSRQFRLGFLVEQSPDFTNRVTLSKTHKDGLGLLRPQIQYDLSDYTKRGLAAAKKAGDAIFAKIPGAQQLTAVADITSPTTVQCDVDGKSVPIAYGGAGHIVGTYRMGFSDNDSVVDHAQRTWEHPNLYLVGSGTFPTIGTGNPSLTMAALALRTADIILKSDLAWSTSNSFLA
jgi:choline dehydrogenase-like flavoprotein